MLTTNPIEHLIVAFEDRARRILRETPPHYSHAPIALYLKRFRKLHERHVAQLKNGRFLSAYGYLVAIRDLSQRLERDEHRSNPAHKRPTFSLRLASGSLNKGRIVCGYLTGDMTPYSPQYRALFQETKSGRIAWPNLTGYWAGLLPRGRRQRAAIAFYERIVAAMSSPTPCEEGRILPGDLISETDPTEIPGILS